MGGTKSYIPQREGVLIVISTQKGVNDDEYMCGSHHLPPKWVCIIFCRDQF